jgi:hypothetical protein
MAESETPLLDELEKGPWPSFVSEMKRAAGKKAAAKDLLRQLERSYNDKIGHWKHGGIVGVRGYGGGVIGDTSPLRALAVAWAETDPRAALQVVDLMDREVDKAEALRAIAAASGDSAIFEQALAMAARVSGDALAPAQASLSLADAAFAQAYDIAQRISTKYK